MNVSVLGTGSIGLATAALLAHHGHAVTVWSPTGSRTAALAGGQLAYTGVISGSAPVAAAASAKAALDAADVAFICVPAFAHLAVIEAAAPHVRAGQTIVVMPVGALSPLLLAQRVKVPCTLIGLGTTVMTGRRGEGAAVKVAAIRNRLDLAALPARANPAALALMQGLFGDRFDVQDNLLGIALSNVNPVAHVPLVLGNLTRVDKRERWPQYDLMTTSVSGIIEANDAERLAVARAFGLAVPSIHDHFERSFGVARGPFAEMAQAVYQMRGGPDGPVTLEDRYLLEDIPYGLAFYSALGRIAGVPTPATDACITLAEAAIRRPLVADNRLTPAIGLEHMDRAALLAAVAGR
jgi:opine dehydrogenase